MRTQEDIILAVLKDHPEGIHPTTLVKETNILQYGSRILGLRARFDCNHAKDRVCFASEHIINKKLKNGTTIFLYEKTRKPWDYSEEKKEKVVVVGPQATLF